MIYFMYAVASIIIFNLLVLAFIVWKFGIDVFFDKEIAKLTGKEYNCVSTNKLIGI